MKTKLQVVIALFLAAIIAACGPLWVRVDSQTRITKSPTFIVELPIGWVRAGGLSNSYYVGSGSAGRNLTVDRVLLTHDGLNLQAVDLVRFDVKDAFPHIKKEYRSGMLASEAAELYIADVKASGLENLTVVKNAPTTVAGRPGFEVHIRFKNNRGLQSERLVYGFSDKAGFYVLSYQAPTLHYFPNYKDAFLAIVNSFRLTSVVA